MVVSLRAVACAACLAWLSRAHTAGAQPHGAAREVRVTSAPLATVLREIAPRIARLAPMPVLIPARLSARWLHGGTSVVEGRLTARGYQIDVADDEGCRGARICSFAVFEAGLGERETEGTTRVVLASGATAWYGRERCYSYCSFPFIEWRRGRVLYRIILRTDGTPRQQRNDLIRAADASIVVER